MNMQSYRVVTSNTPEELSQAVEKLLNEGWWLQGSHRTTYLGKEIQVRYTDIYAHEASNYKMIPLVEYSQTLTRTELSQQAKTLVEQEAVA